jgi:citrate (Re)-synthase
MNADRYEQKGTNGLSIDNHTNRLRAHKDMFPLENVAKPELYEDVFPYSEPPRVEFNDRESPMRTPEQLWMTDTTFRDGQQARPPYTADQIVRIFQYLSDIGGPNGMIRQSEFFLYTAKDREAVEKCKSLGLEYPEITSWVRANKKDFKLAKEIGMKETGILTSVSDYHIFKKISKTREQAIDLYIRIVQDALDVGILPRCHFEDITKADFYGFVLPYAQKLMELSNESKTPIKIRICDTLGVAVPYTGTALPLSIPGLAYGLNYLAGVPSSQLEWHGHNDFGFATINAVTAWLYGCSVVNGTAFGFGERTGNLDLFQAAIHYWRLKGSSNGMNLEAIVNLKDYFKNDIKTSIPNNHPLTGGDAFSTAAGVHIDGLLKGGIEGKEGIMYLPMDPKIVGAKVDVKINDTSGTAGIAYKINELLGLANGAGVKKDNPGVKMISQDVADAYAKGRISLFSDTEIRELIEKYRNNLFI